MKRCGYCKRWLGFSSVAYKTGVVAEQGTLVPIIVTSANKPKRTWAHKTCVLKWRKIADVKIDTASGDPHLAEHIKWFDGIPQRALEATRRYAERRRQTNRKMCEDCGINPIYWKESRRCNSCAKRQHQRTPQ